MPLVATLQQDSGTTPRGRLPSECHALPLAQFNWQAVRLWRDLACVACLLPPPCIFRLTPEGGDVGFRCDDSVAPIVDAVRPSRRLVTLLDSRSAPPAPPNQPRARLVHDPLAAEAYSPTPAARTARIPPSAHLARAGFHCRTT